MFNIKLLKETEKMPIALKRIYEAPVPQDGYRVLVDRLWPRGLSKERTKIDQWLKEAAPSDWLRKSFHSGELSWDDFERSYLLELEKHEKILKTLVEHSRKDQVTLLFSSKNEEKNNASVLKHYLIKLESRKELF